MKIGLVDVDGHNFPNLALMKISAWHKAQGDTVVWWNGFEEYDRVYMSKVFTFTPDMEIPIRAREIIKGGTGYRNYGKLPDEIDKSFPDYSIYPEIDYAVGFLTRGCIRKCPWCVVPKKEGNIAAYSTWQKIKRSDSNKIVFMDNNVLSCEHGRGQIRDMAGKPIRIDFNQGLDARLIDAAVAKELAALSWIRFLRVSCDTAAMLPVVARAKDALLKAGMPKSRLFCYALIQDVSESLERIKELDSMGFTVFAQAYRDFESGAISREAQRLERWCNMKAVMKSCDFENYKG